MTGIEINSEILSLTILTALTVIGYMIAINARGVTRMSLTYLLATLLLAANVFAIVQYVNGRASEVREVMYQTRLASEKAEMKKKIVESSVNDELIREQELKSDEVLKVQPVIAEAQALAEELATANLQDYTLTFEQKNAHAASMRTKTQRVKAKYSSLEPELVYTKDSSIGKAMDKLVKSGLYCKLYYTAEDSDQEVVRERVMRTNAKSAKELFQSVNLKLESMKK